MPSAVFDQFGVIVWVDNPYEPEAAAAALGKVLWEFQDNPQARMDTRDALARALVSGQQQRIRVTRAGVTYDAIYDRLPASAVVVASWTMVPPVELTMRELEVLRMMCQDIGPTEAARRLGVKVSTIETHRSHLLRKINVVGTAGAVRWAIRHGIIAP